MHTETRPGRKHLLLALIMLVTAVAAAVPAAASASTTLDVRGTFNAQGQGGGPYTITLTDENCSTGAVSGTASGGIGPENGTLTGNQLTLHEAYGGYTSDITATVSADTSSFSGTFHDSNHVTAPWNATRTSGPPATPPPGCSTPPPPPPPPPPDPTPTPTPTPAPAPAPAPGGQHATSTQVICNYVVLTSTDTCTATVGDAAGPASTTPTGSVSFASPRGVFLYGHVCSLSATSGSVSSCSVQYLPQDMYLPSLSAAYGGDATHSASTGRTRYLGAVNVDATPVAPPAGGAAIPSEVDMTIPVPVSDSLVTACALPASGAAPARASGLLGDIIGGIGASVGSVVRNLNLDSADIARSASSPLDALEKTAPELIKMNQDIRELMSVFASDPGQRTQQVQSSDGQMIIEAVQRALQAEAAQCGASAPAAAPRTTRSPMEATASRARQHAQRLVPLAVVVRRHVAAGAVTLKLKLNRRRLATLLAHRRSVRIFVRVNLALPSTILGRGGFPLALGESITVRRGPVHRRHR